MGGHFPQKNNDDSLPWLQSPSLLYALTPPSFPFSRRATSPFPILQSSSTAPSCCVAVAAPCCFKDVSPQCFFFTFSSRHRCFASCVVLFKRDINLQLLKLVSTPIHAHSLLSPLLAVNLHPFPPSSYPLPPSGVQIHPSPPRGHPPHLLVASLTPPHPAIILHPCCMAVNLTPLHPAVVQGCTLPDI